MKKISGCFLAGALLIVSALSTFATPTIAADKDLSEQIYGRGKATLRWPDEDNRQDVRQESRQESRQDSRQDSRSSSGYPEYYGGERLTTFNGTVSRVRSRDYFDFRSSDGCTYRVIARDNNDSFNVSTGSRVEVRGFVTSDIIIASRVRESGGGGYGNYQVDFPGVVSSVSGSYRFSVRGDNGRTYTIDSRRRLPNNLSNGDYVRIIGTWNYNAVAAEQVIVLRDGYGGGNGGGYGNRPVDFPATVIDVDRYRNTLRVRGENGVTYTVTYTGSDNLRTGERVRVVGYSDGATVRATAIYRR